MCGNKELVVRCDMFELAGHTTHCVIYASAVLTAPAATCVIRSVSHAGCSVHAYVLSGAEDMRCETDVTEERLLSETAVSVARPSAAAAVSYPNCGNMLLKMHCV